MRLTVAAAALLTVFSSYDNGSHAFMHYRRSCFGSNAAAMTKCMPDVGRRSCTSLYFSSRISAIFRKKGGSEDKDVLKNDGEEEEVEGDDDEEDNALTLSDLEEGVNVTRLQKLKDRMWARETLEDLTAAEFACSLDSSSLSDSGSSSSGGGGGSDKKSTAVDYEKLSSKLDRRMLEICVKDGKSTNEDGEQCMLPDEIAMEVSSIGDGSYSLIPSKGMGSFVYSTEQRMALLERLVVTRRNLAIASGEKVVTEGDASESKKMDEEKEDLENIRQSLKSEVGAKSDTKKSDNPSGDPIMYVRDDGSIDWDGALQDREALRKFGTSVWARINGQNPENISDEVVQKIEEGKPSEEAKKVVASVMETETIRAMKEKLDELEEGLKELELAHNVLLNSGVSPRTAVANVKLASVDPDLRLKIRESSMNLDKVKDEIAFQLLNYELERIFVYLEGEVGNTSIQGYIPLQDRLTVAEFGLLESQVDGLNKLLEDGEIIDSDVLAVVVEQVTDLKRRLGIDYYVQGLTYDSEAIKRWLNDLWINVKKGAAFYGKGCVLLWSDMVFCLNLFGRALQGYTLKPREVRTLRRTIKDIITFIPVVIILIIPLSPVGHVFVFGAIQRFFPDFFPTCFSERRQNLLQLYESTEYSELTIKEGLRDKIIRASEAATYIMSENIRKLFKKLSGQNIEEK